MISNGTYRNLDSYHKLCLKMKFENELKFDFQFGKMLFIFPVHVQTSFQFMVS